jgi:large subunit ribosomal protein L29
MKKNIEVRELSVKELQERVDADRDRLTKMKINHAVSPIENPNQIKELRRDIARMLTELRSRELGLK